LKENDIPAGSVAGTGRDGRITKEDAIKAVDAKTSTPAPKAEAPAATPAPKASAPAVAFSREVERKKMTRMRRTIAKRLVSAKNETAMLTTFNEVDLTELMALREKYQDKFVAKYGIKLGFMSLFAKACAKVLLQMPEVNAMIDGEEFVYHNYADISCAISTPNGLVVPPIRNVESLSFAEIEIDLPEDSMRWRKRDPHWTPPQGGESLAVMEQRVRQTLNELAERHMGQHIALFAHGGVMDLLYRIATGQDLQAPRSWTLTNTAVNRLLWTPESVSLVGWADTSHLDKAARDEAVHGVRAAYWCP
jgi:hypothetical protein